MKTTGRIIPVAAGKGGVGKSFLTANLAIALAEMGHSVIAADLDLGGSNLHSFLGLHNRYPGIGDFLKARTGELRDLLVATGTPGLKFLPGDGRTPFLANIPYAQKNRLRLHLKGLPADFILLDLGAGSSFNTLDFFRLSNQGLLVTTPEYPSIMSMLAFLKHFLLRTIERHFIKEHAVLEFLRETYRRAMGEKQLDMETLKGGISAIDPSAGEKAAAICRACRPRIVFNMGEDPEEIRLAAQINKSLWDYLSLKAEYFGFVFEDSTVRRSVRNRTAFLTMGRDNPAAQSILRVADRIGKYWDRKVENSAQLLLDSTKRLYGDFKPSAL